MGRSATGRRLIVVLTCALMLLGAYFAARPLVADLLWAHASAQAKEELMTEAAARDNEELEALLEAAQAYNTELARQARGAHELSAAEEEAYLAQLGGAETSQIMGAIEIPALGLVEKVCFGTSETTLMAGLGHCAWSSLPVGGASTHCVLAGHSGMEDHRMLDDATSLKAGDHVYVTVLGKTLSYEVTALETVLPSQTDSLRIEEGHDLLTLVTCVPYGVNSHRLLVHCERCGHEPEERPTLSLAALVVASPTGSISWVRVLPVGLVLATLALLGMHLWRQNHLKERSKTHERKVIRHRHRSRRSLRFRSRYRRRRRRRSRIL